MDAPADRGPAGPSDWARLGRGTIIPILLLVGLLVVLAHVHMDLATGYTAPRVVADGKRVLVFFDEGGREAAFYWRASEDAGRTFGRKERVHGVLGGAVLHGERLVALLADDGPRGARWFFSLYDKKTLERRWSGVFDDPELGLDHPRHLARLGDAVYAIGTDRQGALRAARLGESRAMLPTPARLADAALLKPGERPAPPAFFTSAELPGPTPRLLLFWRVLADPTGSRLGPGEVRWTTFEVRPDGTPAFGTVAKLATDLVAGAAVTTPAGEVLLLGAPTETPDKPAIHVWHMLQTGPPEERERIPYAREGLAGGAGVAALAAAFADGDEVGERLLVVAQIGGSIRYRAREGEVWSDWQDVARVPAEQRAVVYGWGASLLALSGLLVFQGLRALRRPRRPPGPPRDLGELCARALAERAQEQAPPPPAPASTAEPPPTEPPEAAPLPDRMLAFVVDVAVVVVVGSALVAAFAPGVRERAASDPRAQLALGAMFVAGVVAYFAFFEALFARTPGKRLLDLEVQDLQGGRPSRWALLFRNLFRVELLLPPPYLTMMLSLLIVLVSPHRQRPGDLLARTAVRRARPAGGAA
ncbi:MAG: RDD family protein [Planctomycetes bacterium]|nr:RDD family protein [Planctomycetota bacterium]